MHNHYALKSQMPDSIAEHQKPNNHVSLIILLGLGFWVIMMLVGSLWFQERYVQAFTEEPTFLQPDRTQNWFNELKPLLPEKRGNLRLIQFWLPECLCNRFAKEHALNTIEQAKTDNVEHITLVPQRFESQLPQLQRLNPDTQIIALPFTQAFEKIAVWPSSPTVLLEDALGNIQYFGPLGYGAFCSQASTSIIERQLQALSSQPLSEVSDQIPSALQPYFNVVGKGCFCPWG